MLGDRPLTTAEKSKRYRAKLKAARPSKPEPRTTVERMRLMRRRQRQQDLLAGLIPATRQRKSDKALLAEARREQRRARMAADAALEAALPAADWRVDHGDFRSWNIEPGSVDLVLTDPPYGRRFLDLHKALPHYAERWLGEEGYLAVMCGKRYLPEVLAALTSGPLRYFWSIDLAHSPGRATGIQFAKVQSVSKPVVVLRKGKPVPLEWMADLISYDWKPDDGDHHRWQQEVSPFQKLIRWLIRPGAVVVDPMCGSGTWIIAGSARDAQGPMMAIFSWLAVCPTRAAPYRRG